MKQLILAFFLGILPSAFGQNEEVIHGLNATEFNGKVLLTWSVTKGKTCNGVKILHSLDSVNFTQIGTIEGICGSSEESIAYEFTHVDPDKNEVNYYRLHLGGVGYSIIVSAEVLDLQGTNYLLRPNPVVDHSELFFDNETAATYTLRIFNLEGKEVHSEFTTGELFRISHSELISGAFRFTIGTEVEPHKISGNLVIQ